jgi:hypothetical protein
MSSALKSVIQEILLEQAWKDAEPIPIAASMAITKLMGVTKVIKWDWDPGQGNYSHLTVKTKNGMLLITFRNNKEAMRMYKPSEWGPWRKRVPGELMP